MATPQLKEIERRIGEYDDKDWMVNNFFWRNVSKFVRAESMNVSNDPRFFAANVMEHRLSAYAILSIINSLMFGVSLKQSFALKKNMDFSKVEPYVGNVAIWQIISFFIALAITIMCLLSLYILAHQLFLTFRLMTAGPSGFDQSAIFYLTRSITMWRHASIKFLFNGLLMFLLLVSMQLFVKFYKDADVEKEGFDEVWLVNIERGNSVNRTLAHGTKTHDLNMTLHVTLGYITLFICFLTAIGMYKIRQVHLDTFHENYRFCQSKTHEITSALRSMSHRSGHDIET